MGSTVLRSNLERRNSHVEVCAIPQSDSVYTSGLYSSPLDFLELRHSSNHQLSLTLICKFRASSQRNTTLVYLFFPPPRPSNTGIHRLYYERNYIMTTSICYKFLTFILKTKYEFYSFRFRTSIMVVRWIFHCSDDVAINYGTFHFVLVGKSRTNTSFIFYWEKVPEHFYGFLTVFCILGIKR